jgi:hypothetical protein
MTPYLLFRNRTVAEPMSLAVTGVRTLTASFIQLTLQVQMPAWKWLGRRAGNLLIGALGMAL